MTHAQQTHTGTVSLMPVAMAGLVMAAALAGALAVTGQISLPSIQTDAARISQDQAVIDAGRAWEHQHEQQAGRGLVTPDVMEAARDWQRQREQQAGASGALDEARQLEIERKAQSGYSPANDVTPTDPKIR